MAFGTFLTCQSCSFDTKAAIVSFGDTTTSSKKRNVETVYCLVCCSIHPDYIHSPYVDWRMDGANKRWKTTRNVWFSMASASLSSCYSCDTSGHKKDNLQSALLVFQPNVEILQLFSFSRKNLLAHSCIMGYLVDDATKCPKFLLDLCPLGNCGVLRGDESCMM